MTIQMMGQLPSKLFSKEVNFESDTIKLMLLDSSATPNVDVHIYIEDLEGNEISGGSYTTGGATVSNKSINLDLDNYQITFESDNITFSNLSDTIGSGVLYSVESSVIIGYIDLEDIVASGSDLEIQLTSSVLYSIDTFCGIMDSVSTCVYSYSPFKRLTRAYTDELVQVTNLTTSATSYFGYDVDGNLETDQIISWLDGANGCVTWVCNEFKTANPTYQSTASNAPIIVTSGVLESDGLKFNGTSQYMQCDDYSEIQITARPMNIYCNYKRNATHNGYIVSKTVDSGANTQYAILNTSADEIKFYLEGTEIVASSSSASNILSCLYYDSINRSHIIVNENLTQSDNNFSDALTNRANFRIGCRHDSAGHALFLNGHIKTVLIFNDDNRNRYYYLNNIGL